MLEILIISAIITARLHARDRLYAKQGLTPPSTRLVEGWLNNRKARGQAPATAKPAKYGMWRYFWQRWQALWEVLAEQHKIKHEAYLKDRAEALRSGKPAPEKPRLKEKAAIAWAWVVDNVIAPVGTRSAEAEAPGRGPADPPSADQVDSDGLRRVCPRCNQTLINSGGVMAHPSSAGCPAAKPPPQPADIPTPGRPAPPEPPSTLTTPPAGNGTSSEGAPMSTSTQQTTGEVTGLTSAINFAETVAAAHAQHSTAGGEQYRAALARAEVGAETIQTAAEAQEASGIAKAKWERHRDKLKEQLAAKEHTTSETGNKGFLLTE